MAAFFVEVDHGTVSILGWTLGIATTIHFLILVFEHLFTPSATLHHELAVRAIVKGAFSRLFWLGALGLGCVVPMALVLTAGLQGFPLGALILTSLTALAGGLVWEYIWVEAGQSVPLS